jgi:hypothetical protein
MFNVTNNTWFTTNLSQPRYYLASTSSTNKIFFGGGYNSSRHSNVVDIFEIPLPPPAPMTPTTPSTPTAPTPTTPSTPTAPTPTTPSTPTAPTPTTPATPTTKISTAQSLLKGSSNNFYYVSDSILILCLINRSQRYLFG